MNRLILDVQGFNVCRGGKTQQQQFIAKEVAILSTDGVYLQHFLFDPPFPWSQLNGKHQALWLKHHQHGLSWCDGNIPYAKLAVTLNKVLASAEVVYVKGSVKETFLRDLLGDTTVSIINVENETSAPDLRETHNFVSCGEHRRISVNTANELVPACSLRNVYKLQFWLVNERET